MNQSNLFKAIPTFDKWMQQASSEYDAIHNFVSFNFKVKHLIMAISLIRPAFIEVDGLILRADKLPEDVDAYLSDLKVNHNWSNRQIEYAINHLHIEDYFLNDSELNEYPPEAVTDLAGFVAQSWSNLLQQTYPDRRFEIGVTVESGLPEIFCYQKSTT